MNASYLPLMVQLNESEKRALQIVLVFIAITFIVVGIIANVIKTRLAKEGEAIDAYMYPMVQYGVIKNPQEFRRYVFKRESRHFYIAMRWTLRTFFLLFFLYLWYMITFQGGNFGLSSTILRDMFFDLEWPTVKIFGLRLISDWPTVVKHPQFYLTIEGYITYIMALGALGVFIKLMFVTLTFIGRLQRSSHVAFKSFSKNLESGVDIIQDE